VQISSRVHHELSASPEGLWAVLRRVDDYQRWWPWLRGFEADALSRGARWSCEVRPPLGYPVRFELELVEVRAPHLVTARVHGDITGEARLDIAPNGSGSEISLASSLAPSNALLRTIARLAEPVARRSHDWVLAAGIRQFVDRAL
jgi:uncharacterized protein YndB with AHSA1/START domain